MANIKSAEKRIHQTALRQKRNRGVRSRLRGAIKEHRESPDAGKGKSLPGTVSQIDRALKKGVIHRNAAARYKSRLAKQAAAKAR
jgi:small subunit ribosomal protein S20